mmetsp:Transcript_43387/g.116443  ORF Transcript_43387/g.116443 Transcript_43387/m.116443 type:complete len:372 (-) Transcript_43387:50-1165(-)
MSQLRGMRFVGRPIDRAATLNIRKDAEKVKEIQRSGRARFLVTHLTVKERGGAAIMSTTMDPPSIAWWTSEELRAVSMEAERGAIYLGPVVEGGPALDAGVEGPVEAFAVDLSPFLSLDAAKAQASEEGRRRWTSGRELLTSSAADCDVTMAGLALALVQWSDKSRFDGCTGKPTEAMEGGVKRQEIGGRGRTYPRTDPVAIGLIVSPDQTQILLAGRPGMIGMYTCISGFVDQCESVEEAFRREAVEEVGVRLASVELFASQAWPLGRAGSCELMVGCRAVASSMHITPNLEEVSDARWFGRPEVLTMLQGTHPEKLWVPGPYAIAHHLIQSWASGAVPEARSSRVLAQVGPAVLLAIVAVAASHFFSRL